MVEDAHQVRDSAIDSSKRAWQAARAAETVEAQAKEEAERSVLSNQAAAHNRVIEALTSKRDGLRTQLAELRDGKGLLVWRLPL